MNEHDSFEQRLRRQPLRPVPPAWREDILAQANAAARLSQQNAALETASEDRAELVAGWRLLFARLPLAWASLAALWIVIIGANLTLPSPIVHVAVEAPASARLVDLAALDIPAMDYEVTSAPHLPTPEAAPASKPSSVPFRPRSERRRGQTFGELPPLQPFDDLA